MRSRPVVLLGVVLALTGAACSDSDPDLAVGTDMGSGVDAPVQDQVDPPSVHVSNGLTIDGRSMSATGRTDCEADEAELTTIVGVLDRVPYRKLIDPIAPSSIEVMRALGYSRSISGTVVAITPVFAGDLMLFEKVEQLPGNSVAWDGYMVAIEVAGEDIIEAPVVIAVGATAGIEAERAAPEQLSVDLSPLVGACVFAMAGNPSADPLELGAPTVLAVGASDQLPAIAFDTQFEQLVGESTIESLAKEGSPQLHTSPRQFGQ